MIQHVELVEAGDIDDWHSNVSEHYKEYIILTLQVSLKQSHPPAELPFKTGSFAFPIVVQNKCSLSTILSRV